MKKCTYCGRENSDDVARCGECGTEFLATAATNEVPAPWDRIAVLAHEVEAERLGVELDQRAIPHVMVSYGDSAFDGLFQAGHGWGHVEAPGEHKDTILSLLDGIRQPGSSAPESPTVQDPAKAERNELESEH